MNEMVKMITLSPSPTCGIYCLWKKPKQKENQQKHVENPLTKQKK